MERFEVKENEKDWDKRKWEGLNIRENGKV